jgi:hypothetical protein
MERGSSACVHSLHGRPELNGEIVTLTSFDESTSRWICRTADGGRVALRATNLHTVRNRGVHAPLETAPRFQLSSLPWKHFIVGLCVTLAVGHIGLSLYNAHNLRRAATRPSARANARSAAGFRVEVVSWLPLAGLVTLGFGVWALFVDSGADPLGTPLQRRVRAGVARAAAAVSEIDSFKLLVLVLGLMLSWSLYTDQLQLNLDMSQMIMLPAIAYVLWRSRDNLHNMNPFQLLMLIDMMQRVFRPGGGGGGYRGGYRRRTSFF